MKIPRYDQVPSDRLVIRLLGGQVHWRTERSDGREPTIEDALPRILQELGLRSAAAEAKRKADEEAAAQKRRRWEAAMVQVRLPYEEPAKANALHRQIEGWQKAGQVRRFLGFAREAVGGMPTGTESVAAEQWLEWIAAYADRLDPLAQPLRMPDLPEPRPKDLEPHMNGWSAYHDVPVTCDWRQAQSARRPGCFIL